ncbi:MAG: PhzF family phenazine biosynthesis protein [Neptuniibacter sp.]
MKLPIYQIDAFAEKTFEGNPAAVVPLEEWLPDEIMQSIAEENNLAETAFFVPTDSGFHIRWFTPKDEVKLCGHATLASAYVLFNCLGYKAPSVSFDSLSGELTVTRGGEYLTLDFPNQMPVPCEVPQALVDALGIEPKACLANEDYMAVFSSEEEVAAIQPDYRLLEQLDRRGLIVTAPGNASDFVARFFAPKLGVPEDPVTGSAYTHLTPYWSEKLGKAKLSAIQISPRTGKLQCEVKGDRVLISGTAVKYLEGTISV